MNRGDFFMFINQKGQLVMRRHRRFWLIDGIQYEECTVSDEWDGLYPSATENKK